MINKELSDLLRVETEFLNSIKNKKLFVDGIWKSKRDKEVEISVRDVIANNIFSPFSGMILNYFDPIFKTCNDENSFFKKLLLEIHENEEFCMYINETEANSIEHFNYYWSEYAGANSLIGYILRTQKFPHRFEKMSEQLLRWYHDERKVAEGHLNGNRFNYAFVHTFPAIHQFLNDFGMSLVTSILANLATQNLPKPKLISSMIKDFKDNILVKRVVESNAPRQYLLDYLFVLDIDESEIEEFKQIILEYIEAYFSTNFPDNKLEILSKLTSHEDFRIEEIRNQRSYFTRVEFDRKTVKYIFDPYGSTKAVT